MDITCGSHQLLNKSVHFSNGTAEIHSDPLELGHADCKAVVSFENWSGTFSEQTIPISIIVNRGYLGSGVIRVHRDFYTNAVIVPE